MWDNFLKFFKKEIPVNEESVQVNIQEQPTEIQRGPKDGMSETHFRDQMEEAIAPNNQPGIAKGRSRGLEDMENASTITNVEAEQGAKSQIKSIIEKGEKTKDIKSYIDQENPTQSWAEKHPSNKAASNTPKTPEQPNTVETPEIEENIPTNEGESGSGFGGGGGGRGGGGGSTPGKDMDVLDGKDDGIDDPDEPLSQNEEGIQNPHENSNDRLASFFRDEKQEVEMDDLPEISDKQKEALYLAFNESNKNLPEIEDENIGFQPEQNEIIEYGDNDRMAAFFRGDDQEIETNDLLEISEEQKNSLYLAFNGEREDSEMEDYFPVDKGATEDFANELGNDGDIDVDMDGFDLI